MNSVVVFIYLRFFSGIAISNNALFLFIFILIFIHNTVQINMLNAERTTYTLIIHGKKRTKFMLILKLQQILTN